MKDLLIGLGILFILGYHPYKTDYFAIEGKQYGWWNEEFVLYDSNDLGITMSSPEYIFEDRNEITQDNLKVKFGKRVKGRYHADYTFKVHIINKTENNINVNNIELKILNSNQGSEIVTKYIAYLKYFYDRTDKERKSAIYEKELSIVDNLQQYTKDNKTLGTYGKSTLRFFYDDIPKDVKNIKLNLNLSCEINGETKEVKKEVEMKRIIENKPRFNLFYWLQEV